MPDFLLRIRTRTQYNGPIFDLRARRAFSDMREELEEEAAEWSLDHIRSSFHRNFKHPTGYYESNVEVRNSSTGHEVWDGGWAGPVYGPWLEGVSDRNSTSRFKGYHAFRRAAEQLERRIGERGEALLYRNVIPRL